MWRLGCDADGAVAAIPAARWSTPYIRPRRRVCGWRVARVPLPPCQRGRPQPRSRQAAALAQGGGQRGAGGQPARGCRPTRLPPRPPPTRPTHDSALPPAWRHWCRHWTATPSARRPCGAAAVGRGRHAGRGHVMGSLCVDGATNGFHRAAAVRSDRCWDMGTGAHAGRGHVPPRGGGARKPAAAGAVSGSTIALGPAANARAPRRRLSPTPPPARRGAGAGRPRWGRAEGPETGWRSGAKTRRRSKGRF